MCYKKKFLSIEELLESKEFENKDLSFCDISALNLSKLPKSTWIDFRFFHTNFSDTGIVFEPTSLALTENGKYCLEYCDFTGCDLSYIKDLTDVSYRGSIFKGTHLNFLIRVENSEEVEGVVFSEEMTRLVKAILGGSLLSLSIVESNPQIPFSSIEIFTLLKENILPPKYSFISPRKYDEYINCVDRALQEDMKREGTLYKMYMLLEADKFSPLDKIRFFQGFVCEKTYGSIDFSSIPSDLLNHFKFSNCHFDEITLPAGKLSRLIIYDENKKNKTFTAIPHIIIPSMDVSSWQQKSSIRLGYTCFTRQTNLYLELGRFCNAKCPFCRNEHLSQSNFDFEAIAQNLKALEMYLNNVVIGGGEPTLPKTSDYLRKIYENRTNYSINYYISTNGSSGIDNLLDFIKFCYYRINLSRHAVEDDDNNRIFGIKTIGIEDIRRFSRAFRYSPVTLVATCFQGGLDTVESLERYIELSDDLQIDSVLFQSLHEDLSEEKVICRQIDDMVFDEVIAHLREQGYYVGENPIYSTGDYKLIIVKSPNGKTIAFKQYITKEELEREWPRASKRTFDLSMAPNGDVYQNWHQASDKVMSLTPKNNTKI